MKKRDVEGSLTSLPERLCGEREPLAAVRTPVSVDPSVELLGVHGDVPGRRVGDELEFAYQGTVVLILVGVETDVSLVCPPPSFDLE